MVRLPSIAGVFDAARRAGPAWLVLLASISLSVVGIAAIDVGEGPRAVAAAHGPGLGSGMGLGLGPIAVRQGLFLLIGIGSAAVILIPHYRWFGYLCWPFYLVMVGLLVFLLLPFVPASIVTPRNGARGWINLGFTDFQPAEMAKIAYVLALAWYMRYSKTHRRFSGLLPPALITAVPVGLITLQPDLGTATLFVPALFAVLVAAGAKLKHLTLIVMLGALGAPATYPLLKPHQQVRIVGLIKQLQGDTSADQDINYQSTTAQALAGAGGISGQPDEHARALVYFNRLPERHNDMIFSVIMTRWGLAGGVAVLGLYLAWLAGAALVAGWTRDPFGRLIAVGLAAFVAGQMFVNIGMNIGVLPIVGITLPFVSYGGSSLVTVWAMTGLLFSIAVRRPRTPVRSSFEHFDDDT